MKKNTIILLLLSFVLLPIIWNGVGTLHYVMEHSHLFCLTSADHEHTSVHECSDIYHLIQDQDQDHNRSLTKIEFHELKQYITPQSSLNIPSFTIDLAATFARVSLQQDRIFSDDIFHPPIS